MKIFGENGMSEEIGRTIIGEDDDELMTTARVATKGTSGKKQVNTNLRKPNSTLVLCALANYMVVSGMTEANIGKYESAVKNMDEPIQGTIIDNDGVVTFVAGEIPESLSDKTVLASYLYEMPVKHNLHINTMGKNYYGISLDEARVYKVTNDLFFVIDASAKESLLAKCTITTDRSHLPSNSEDIESKVTDFYFNPDVKVSIVSARASGGVSSPKASSNGSKVGGTTGKQNKVDNIYAKVINHEKEQSSVKRISSSNKMTLNSTEYASLDVSDLPKAMSLINTVQLRSCDTDPGNGHFMFTFEHPSRNVESRFLISSSDPLTGILTVITQQEITDEESIMCLSRMLMTAEPSGYKIHDLDKTKQKRAFFWNMANYNVFEDTKN